MKPGEDPLNDAYLAQGSALADFARVEVEARRRHYPGMIAAEKLTRAQADDDIRAWERIEQWLRHGSFSTGDRGGPWEGDFRRPWVLLRDAAAQAAERRAEAASANRADQRLADRHRAVLVIHGRLSAVVDAFKPQAA